MSAFTQHRPKILFIGGSMNQTTQVEQIARELIECEPFFTPYYGDKFLEFSRKVGATEFTIIGNKARNRTLQYLAQKGLPMDVHGQNNNYDLVVTASDLVMPKNILNKKVVLVQEGMMEPIGWVHRVGVHFKNFPRYLGNTSMTGLSHAYERFCVASDGYRDLFVSRGVRRERMVVTGIPNFDNCARYRQNTFPHKNFVLVCTSDARETFNFENRKKTILDAVKIAAGRPMIFKLHPNEIVKRATREINRYAPGALIYTSGSAEEMVANCDVVVTKYSSLVYVGIALGKEVYSAFDLEELKRLCPIQNNCASKHIADVCRDVLGLKRPTSVPPPFDEMSIKARASYLANKSRTGIRHVA